MRPGLADYNSRPKYPWRTMAVRATFFVPFTVDELTFPKLRTKKKRIFYSMGKRHGRYDLAFLITRAKLGLKIKRVR